MAAGPDILSADAIRRLNLIPVVPNATVSSPSNAFSSLESGTPPRPRRPPAVATDEEWTLGAGGSGSGSGGGGGGGGSSGASGGGAAGGIGRGSRSGGSGVGAGLGRAGGDGGALTAMAGRQAGAGAAAPGLPPPGALRRHSSRGWMTRLRHPGTLYWVARIGLLLLLLCTTFLLSDGFDSGLETKREIQNPAIDPLLDGGQHLQPSDPSPPSSRASDTLFFVFLPAVVVFLLLICITLLIRRACVAEQNLSHLRRARQRRLVHRLGARMNMNVGALSLMLSDRDFDSNDYEALLALDENTPTTMLNAGSMTEISALPEFPYKKPARPSPVPQPGDTPSKTAPSCSICLEEFEEGETLKILPCFHRFHAACTTKWLLIKAECPVCKVSIRG